MVQHSDATRRKLSIARSSFLEERGGGGFPSVDWFPVANVIGEVFIVRGKLEYAYAMKFNEENRRWIRRVYLDYIGADGRMKRYAPDFFFPDENIYFEAKGWFSATDKQKLNLVCEYNDIALVIGFTPPYYSELTKHLPPGSGAKSGEKRNQKKNKCPDCSAPCTGFRCKPCSTTVMAVAHSRRVSKIDWPATDVLCKMILNSSYETVAKELGVSSQAIRKHLRVRQIDLPPAFYKRNKDHDPAG